MEALDFFPYIHLRKGQGIAIAEGCEALECGYKHISLRAPPGTGKSGVGRTLMEFMLNVRDWKSFLLTSTIHLQNQYQNDYSQNNPNFVNFKKITGRRNYDCKLSKCVLRCDDGLCRDRLSDDKPCPNYMHAKDLFIGSLPNGLPTCDFYEAKERAIHADITLMNYPLLCTENLFGHSYKKRNFMVLDEAHNIEDQILLFVKESVAESTLQEDLSVEFPSNWRKIKDVNMWAEWMWNVGENYERLYNFTKDSNDPIKQAEIERFHGKAQTFKYKSEKLSNVNCEWVVCPDEHINTVEFKPVLGQDYVPELILKSADHHLYMSGSISDVDYLSNMIGVDPSEIYDINIETPWNLRERNPILYYPVTRMHAKGNDFALLKRFKKLKPYLEWIFDRHADEKGLIHTNSTKYASILLKLFEDEPEFFNRFITYHPSSDKYNDLNLPTKTEAIHLLKKSNEPKILVSYSLWEGVDLPDDDCRFQVFTKAPWLNPNDEVVQKHRTLDPDWYNKVTAQKFIQGVGRGMRSADDTCMNYVLDEGFETILGDNSPLPMQIRDSITKYPLKKDFHLIRNTDTYLTQEKIMVR